MRQSIKHDLESKIHENSEGVRQNNAKLEKDLSDLKSTIEHQLNERDSKMANVRESIKKELDEKIVENSQSIKK